jgi:hypothetical protein
MPPRNSHAELETHDVGSGIGTIPSPHVRTTKEGGFIGVQSGDGEGGEAPAPQIIIVQHWFEELQRLVPVD